MTKDEIIENLRIIDEILREYRQEYIKGLTEQRSISEVSGKIKNWETNKKLYIEQLKEL